jgi:transcriptional regulator with GAF, ATPase, and Fis domain
VSLPIPTALDSARLTTTRVAELAREFRSAGSVQHTTDCVVELGPAALDCDWVAVVRQQRDQLTIAASSGTASPVEFVLAAAAKTRQGVEQTTIGSATSTPVLDLGTDSRWPLYAEAVTATTPVRSAFGFPLHNGAAEVDALMFYDSRPGHFDAERQAEALVYAELAATGLAKAHDHDAATNLRQALASSREIGQAIGIIMNAQHLTGDQAFELLRQISQRTHCKLRDIAAYVVVSGQVPMKLKRPTS